MSVLVVHVCSLSMEGCRCVTSWGSSNATRGLLRRCISIAADHIHDLIVDYESLRPVRMVFVKLFEFYAVFFEHFRRYPRIVRPFSPLRLVSSSTTSSPASPTLPRLLCLLRHVGCIDIFYPVVLLRL
jgi:hypothetical protein